MVGENKEEEKTLWNDNNDYTVYCASPEWMSFVWDDMIEMKGKMFHHKL